MKRYFVYFISIFFVFVFTSCSSLRKANDCKTRVKIDETNQNLLTGKFKAISTIPEMQSKADLSWNFFDRGYNAKSHQGFIEIKVLSSDEISVSYWDSITIVKSKVFKGKIKNDYFILKRRYLIIPAIFVNLYRNRIFRIGLLPNNNLITDYNQISFATYYIILPDFSRKREYGVEFQRLH